MSEIIFEYLPQKNPKGKTLTGVPLSDISQAQFDALPKWVQRSVYSCEFYQSVDAKPAPKAKAAAPKAQAVSDKAED